MTTRPLVAIIVLNWNGRDDSAECLASLRAVRYDRRRVILVDNGSTDGSVETLPECCPEVEFLETGRNLGYAEGNNVGIRRALDLGADYVLLLNNDTTVEPDFLSKLADAALTDAKIGIIGPRINSYSRRDRVAFAGGRISLTLGWTWHVGNRATDRGQFAGMTDEDYQTGAAMMISRAALEKVGMFDPGFVSYCEDSDLCLRAKAAGFRVVCQRDAVVYHKISRSTGGGLTPFKAYRKIVSGGRLYRRYSGALRYYTTVAAFNFAYAGATLLAELVRGRFAVCASVLRGFCDLWRGRDRDAGIPSPPGRGSG